MSPFLTLDDVDASHQTVLVRVDLNVPMQEGRVTDVTRVERVLPTIKELTDRQAKIILLSHFGRPKGQRREEQSLKPLLPTLEKVFDQPLLFAEDCIGDATKKLARELQPGQILLLENLRFHAEEEKNDPGFAKALASLGDIYVNDAFSCSHRAHASVVAITEVMPSFAGRGMQAELEALTRVMEDPKRPLMAIVGGSKISTKLDLLKNLVQKVDRLFVGGGIANTFLSALGYSIGQSLCEKEMTHTAGLILEKAKTSGCEVILPHDVVVTTDEIKAHASYRVAPVSEVQRFDKIVDIGDATLAYIGVRLASCRTVIWNGPLGVFEVPPFDEGSVTLAKIIAEQTKKGHLTSVVGGGDTLAALAQAGCAQAFTYTSTAGGAFLEWLEGKNLPGVAVLEANKKSRLSIIAREKE